MKHQWMNFVRTNFRAPGHVADVFSVSCDCATRWWDGENAPSGFAVSYAYQNFPQAAFTELAA